MRRTLTRTLAAVLIFVLALAAGYAASSRLGPELLRRELEVRLGELLHGKVSVASAALVVDRGLRVQAVDLRAYPQAERGPALTVRAAAAGIDLISLALGRFRLNWLRVEGAMFRIEHHEDGTWTPYPIAAIDEQPSSFEDLEKQLVLLRAFEKATRWLLERPVLARRVELSDSQVILLDAHAEVPAELESEGPYELRLDAIQGELRHHWISGQADLKLRATLANAIGEQGTLESEGHHGDDDDLRLAVAGTAVSLEALSPYVVAIDERARLAGTLHGVVAFDTESAGEGRLELDWVIHQLDSVLPLPGTLLPTATPRGTLTAEIEVQPLRLRVNSAQIGGSDVQLDFSSTVERPLRESARLRVGWTLRGAGMEEARSFIDSLPEEDRDTLTRMLQRIEGGHIDSLRGSGSTRISEWRKLLSGKLSTLPPGFVLAADLAHVTMTTGKADRLDDLSATIEWSADSFAIRHAHGRWNDEALPELDAVLEGASNLFLGAPGSSELRATAGPLPGLDTLFEVLLSEQAGADGAPAGEDRLAQMPVIRVGFERLDHPILRWPIDDARAVIETSATGAEVDLWAHWAGAPVVAEAVWSKGPEPKVDIFVKVHEPGAKPPGFELEFAPAVSQPVAQSSSASLAPATAVAPRAEPWAFGHFEIGPSLKGRFPFEAIGGEFRVVESRLSLTDMRVSLPERGHISAFVGAELGEEDVAGVELRFDMQNADMQILALASGLPQDIATGTVTASGFVTGSVRSDQPLLSGLRGGVDIEARDGALQMNVPLLVAVAQATEGFNPLAERESVKYETATTRLELAESRVEANRFVLEGPMRVFATGAIDLRDPSQGSIDAIVGVFLFRQAGTMLGGLPLLGALVSDKGLLGAYFRVRGPLDDPNVKAMPLTSLAGNVPDVIKAPIKMLGFALRGPEPGNGTKRARRPTIEPDEIVDAPAAAGTTGSPTQP